MEWSWELLAERSCTPTSTVEWDRPWEGALWASDPKKLAGGFNWAAQVAAGGWGTSSQTAAAGCGRSSQHCLVVPAVTQNRPGQPQERSILRDPWKSLPGTTWSWGDSWKCKSVCWAGWTPSRRRDCSPSFLELQDHIPEANFLSSLKFQDEQLCCSLARQQLPLYATCLAYISTFLLKKYN